MQKNKKILLISGIIIVSMIAGYVGYRLETQKTDSRISQVIQKATKSLDKEAEEVIVDAGVAEPKPPVFLAFEKELESYAESQKLIQQIKTQLGDDRENYGIYIKDLKTNMEYGVNEDVFFPPASISKLPYGILALKYIDEGKLTFDTRLTLEQRHKFYTTDPMYNFANGSTWSVSDLLRLLLVDSDNIPMNMLEEYFGGVDSFNTQIAALGITNFTRYPHQATPRAVGKTFEMIYKGEVLSTNSIEILRGYLSKYKVFSGDRIRLGIDRVAGRETTVVHKIGNLGGTYHDAGYVLGPQKDFIIITLNKNQTPSQSITQITTITGMTYKYFNP
jgi:beta-lactamase class A